MGVRRRLVACAAIAPLLAIALCSHPATSLAAESTGRLQLGAEAQPVPRYTTANSDTYALPNGHMLTRVYEYPVNYKAASGQWQPLSESQAAKSKAASKASAKQSSATVRPNVERNPLGQENEAACSLTSTAPTTAACNELTFKVGYETATSTARRGLLQFALPELHEELTIYDAQLELYAAKTTTTSSAAMGAYRVTTPWTTGATWNTTNGSTPWRTPGGDYSNPPEAESDAAINSAVGAKKGWVYWYPTKMVQEWYNGTNAPNGQGQADLGFLLKDVSEGPTNNAVSFAGREEREHNPGLTLEWAQRGVGNATNYTELPLQLSPTLGLKVNPASGNLMIHSDDLKVPSKGTEFDSARTWNSLQNEAFGYGYGWVDSNAVNVHVTPTGSVAYTDGTGATFPFVKERANFITPPGIEATLCEAGSAAPCPVTLPKGTTYQLIYTNTQQRINFAGNKEYNYPQEVLNAAGEAETAKYTKGLEEPTTWTDTEKVKIAYTESETLGYTKITNEGNSHSVSYTETVGEDGLPHLVKYANETKETTSYTIGTGLEGNLIKEITEPNGTVIKLSYDSQYRITKIIKTTNPEHTTGPTTTYTYYGYGKAPAPCTATQKATVVAETGGNEEPTITYCANVLDEVEEVSGYPAAGQPGWYALEDEDLSEAEIASVNLASGGLTVKAEDVKPTEADVFIALTRYYNSMSTPAAGTLGPRWRWGTGPGLYLADRGAIVLVHGPSGYTALLKRTSSSTYSGSAEYEGMLTKNADGTYTLTNADNPTYHFNAAGILTSETTEEGNSFSIVDTTLGGTSVLQKLVASSGAALEVKYNATPRASEVVAPGGEKRTYEYNAAGQLSRTATSAGAVEYGYDSNGYLNKITTPEATETVTTLSGKVTEVSVTRAGETGASVKKFSYVAATSPSCKPPSDVTETVVTHGTETEALCFNARGENTTPESEEQEASEGEGPEQPEITEEACEKGTAERYCGQEEVPAEPNEEEEGEEGLAAAQGIRANKAATKPVLKPGPGLEGSRYGIADNNRLTEREAHPGFNIFKNPWFEQLKPVIVRRTIAWNLVLEANRGVAYDQGLLADLEEWIIEVRKLNGGHGQPLITFEHCYEPGQWVNPEPEAKGAIKQCDEPAGTSAYKLAVEAFLGHQMKNGEGEIGHLVHRYTPWDEPNNRGTVGGEHVEPTYNRPDLAGNYWYELDELCRTTKYDCEVAAGDFLDKDMSNALSEYNKHGVVNPEYNYIKEYLNAMKDPHKANRWAWHAYGDGANTQKGAFKGNSKKWWGQFKNFAKVVQKFNPAANIWLTEQGAVFTEPGHKRIPRGDEGMADSILTAFVKSGKRELTRISGKIKSFYYYEMRAEDPATTEDPKTKEKHEFEGFDTGLLEEKPEKVGEPTYNGRSAGAPRHIYYVYKEKTLSKRKS